MRRLLTDRANKHPHNGVSIRIDPAALADLESTGSQGVHDGYQTVIGDYGQRISFHAFVTADQAQAVSDAWGVLAAKLRRQDEAASL